MKVNMLQVLREEDFNHSCLFAVQLSRSDLMMFIAGTKGAILSVRYPMPRPPEYSEFFLHNNPITKVGKKKLRMYNSGCDPA